MATITNGNLKFKRMINKPIVASYTFFTVITFININSCAYIYSITIQHLQIPFVKNQETNLHEAQKGCH